MVSRKITWQIQYNDSCTQIISCPSLIMSHQRWEPTRRVQKTAITKAWTTSCRKNRTPQRQESGRDQTTAKVCQRFFRLGSRSPFTVWRTNQDKLGSPLARPVVDSIVSDKLTFNHNGKWELAYISFVRLLKPGMRVKPAQLAGWKPSEKEE